MTTKFKQLVDQNKKKQETEEVHALYKIQKKPAKNRRPSASTAATSEEDKPVKKPPVPRFS